MIAALPATAPAKPVKPHKVLAWSRIPSAGFQHSSIPLAVKAIEELGKKTGCMRRARRKRMSAFIVIMNARMRSPGTATSVVRTQANDRDSAHSANDRSG